MNKPKKSFVRDSLVFETRPPFVMTWEDYMWQLAGGLSILSYIGFFLMFMPSLHPRAEFYFILGVWISTPIAWTLYFVARGRRQRDVKTA